VLRSGQEIARRKIVFADANGMAYVATDGDHFLASLST
jgi:hypothetical protein